MKQIKRALAGFGLGAAILLSGCADPLRRGEVFAPGIAGPAREDQLEIGHRLMAAGEYELALKAFTRAGGQQGLTAEVLSALGSANLALGRLGQAEDLLRRATKADENDPSAWNNLGVVLMETRQYPEAVQVFRRAFATASGQSDVIRDNLAKALAKRDDPFYAAANDSGAALVLRGTGNVLLLTGG